MSLPAEEIVARLRNKESLASIVLSLLPVSERELLRRCAGVREFDVEIYEAVLRPRPEAESPTSLSFEQLIRRDDVEPVPRKPGFYSLKESARTEYLQAWIRSGPGAAADGVPPAMRELSRELVRYYAQRRPEYDLELLYHQVIAERDRAAGLLAGLYAEADAKFDLPRCHSILQTLDEIHRHFGDEVGPSVLGTALSQQIAALRLTLDLRSLWTREYYQTAYYLERPSLEPHVASLLGDDPHWILHVHAPGGTGKTMFLRWLIARRCVPERIPCARVDFDFFDPLLATQEPRLLLLKWADQLNRQLPEQPFQELPGVPNPREYVAVFERQEQFRRRGAPAPAGPTESLPSQPLPARLERDFATKLAENRGSEPVLLIFDTMEEVSLYQPDTVVALARLVARLRAGDPAHGIPPCPGLRLVLSGRYDLRAQLPDLARDFGDQMVSLDLPRFTPEEARRYLKERRSLSEEQPLEVVIERSEGNPFKLALFADILRATPDITEHRIRAYPTVDLTFLIERVVDHIPDPYVRWVLRYGAIPRQLTFEFVDKVMRPHMQPSEATAPPTDDPNKGLPPDLQNEARWPVDLPAPPALREVWDNLCRYAGSSSWVWPVEGVPDAVQLQNEVVNPMRALLQQNPIFDLLHGDAIPYYEGKAERLPGEWGRWTREAIYHRFQREGAGASGFWEEKLAAEPALLNPRWRQEVAMEVVGSEYLAGAEPRLRHDNSRMIAPETVMKAYYEAARAAVERAHVTTPPGSAHLAEADGFLKQAATWEQRTEKPGAVLPPAGRALVQAAVLSHDGRHAEAEQILGTALEEASDAEDRRWLEFQWGETLAATGQPLTAIAHYREALALAASLEASVKLVRPLRRFALLLHEKLARQYEAAGDPAHAILEYEAALPLAREAHAAGDAQAEAMAGELWLRLGTACVVTGQIARAERLAFTDPPPGLEWASAPLSADNALRRELLQVRVLLDLGRLPAALASNGLAPGLRSQQSSVSPTDSRAAEGDDLIAYSVELLGNVSAALMDFERAPLQLSRARQEWGQLGRLDESSRCLARMVELQMRDIGNLNEASSLLEDARSLLLREGSTPWYRLERLRAELTRRRGDHPRASEQLTRLAHEARDQELPWLAARVAAEGVLYESEAHPGRFPFVEELIHDLERIEPISARFRLLEPLRRSAPWQETPPRLIEALEALLPLPPPEDPDFPYLAPARAHLCRATGRDAEAAALFRDIAAALRRRQDWFQMWAVLPSTFPLLGESRALHASLASLDDWTEPFLSVFGSFPALCGAAHLENAGRRLLAGDLEAAADCLREAVNRLDAMPVLTQWHARSHELDAHVAWLRGDRPKAALAFEEARTIYERLTDTVALQRVGALVSDLMAGQSSPLAKPQTITVGSQELAIGVEKAKLVTSRQSMSPEGAASEKETELAPVEYPVILWDLAESVPSVTLPHEASERAIAVRPDGRLIATGGRDRWVRLWRLPSGEEEAQLEIETEVRCVAFSPGAGQLLAAADVGGAVCVWRPGAAKRVLRADSAAGRARGLAFSPDERYLAVAGSDGWVRIWDVEHEEETERMEVGAAVNAVAFSPDNRYLAIGTDDHRVCLARYGVVPWLAESYTLEAPVLDVVFGPSGMGLAVAEGSANRAWLFDLPQSGSQLLAPFQRFLHPARVTALAFSADGQRLATACDDGVARVWGFDGEEEARLPCPGAVTAVAFLPEAPRLAVATTSVPAYRMLMSMQQDNEVQVSVMRDAGLGEELQTTRAEESDLVRLIVSRGPDETVAHEFVYQWLERPNQIGVEMAALLLGPEARAALARRDHGEPPWDFRIVNDQLLFDPFPWELVTLPDGPGLPLAVDPGVRYFYRARWPQPMPIPERLSLSEKPAVLLLQPSLQREISRSRGSRFRGFSTAKLYESHGFEVELLEDPDPERLRATLARSRAVCVLHLSGTMGDSPSLGGAYLDFAGEPGLEARGYQATTFSASVFRSVLSNLPRTPPLLVLDVPRPAGATETARQLLLRNAVAGAIFQSGLIPAILATGLGEGDEIGELGEALVGGLAGGWSVGGIASRIRRLAFATEVLGNERAAAPGGTVSPERQIAFLGAALFTQDPTLRPVERPRAGAGTRYR